jgi:chromosome segregation ATPase
VAELERQLSEKQEAVGKREQEIVRQRAWIQTERQSLSKVLIQFEEQQRAVVAIERECAATEQKCDQLNDELNREAEELDRALFAASSMRADSRIHHLQMMLEARTGSTFIEKTVGTAGESLVELLGWPTTR